MAYALTPEFAPGARWNYSNTGYVAARDPHWARSRGRFYGDLLRDRVFTPLGMKTARIISEADIVPHRADGYRLVDDELKHHEWVAPTLNTTADGSLYLSLNDMIAWDAGIRDKKVLTGRKLDAGTHAGDAREWQAVSVRLRLVRRDGQRPPRDGARRVVARVSDALRALYGRRAERDRADEPGAGVTRKRSSKEIAAMLVPALTVPEPKPIEDPAPEVEARVRALIESARAGTLDPKEFAYVRAGFFPHGTSRYAEMLGKAGALAVDCAAQRPRAGGRHRSGSTS